MKYLKYLLLFLPMFGFGRKLYNVLPAFAQYYVIDSRGSYAENLRYLILTHISRHFSNLPNFFFRQLTYANSLTAQNLFRVFPRPMIVALRRSITSGSISHIILMSTKIKMIWINAITNVAFMQNIHLPVKIAIMKKIGIPVSSPQSMTVPKNAISGLRYSAEPKPAAVCFVDQRPKFSFFNMVWNFVVFVSAFSTATLRGLVARKELFFANNTIRRRVRFHISNFTTNLQKFLYICKYKIYQILSRNAFRVAGFLFLLTPSFIFAQAPPNEFGTKKAYEIKSLNGLADTVQTMVFDSAGTNVNIVSSVATHTLNFPTATASKRGLLGAADWFLFNAKEPALTFSTGLTRASQTITSDIITGKAGGQTAIGGTASTENLILSATSNATKGYVGITYAPRATANYGSFSMGSGAFDGSTSGFFVGNANGTQQAINMASGSTADYQNFQIAGVNVYKLSNSGQGLYHANSVVSTPIGYWDGTWYAAGSATTSKPHLLIEPSGTTSTGWSAVGTGLGINAANTFTGNLFDAQLNGASRFKVSNAGDVTALNSYLLAAAASFFQISGTNTATSSTFAPLQVNRNFTPSGAGSGSFRPVSLVYTLNGTAGAQSGTATGYFLNATETTLNGLTHNLMDLQVGGVSKFLVNNAGNTTISGSLFANLNVSAGLNSNFVWVSRSLMKSPSDGVIGLYNNGSTDFNRQQYGGTTSAFPSWQRSGAGFKARLADDSNNTTVTASQVILDNTVSLATTGGAATAGQFTLVGGTVTVNTTAMTATALAFFQRKTAGGTIGMSITYTQVNGTSFTATSDNPLDTSTYNWQIIETH